MPTYAVLPGWFYLTVSAIEVEQDTPWALRPRTGLFFGPGGQFGRDTSDFSSITSFQRLSAEISLFFSAVASNLAENCTILRTTQVIVKPSADLHQWRADAEAVFPRHCSQGAGAWPNRVLPQMGVSANRDTHILPLRVSPQPCTSHCRCNI